MYSPKEQGPPRWTCKGFFKSLKKFTGPGIVFGEDFLDEDQTCPQCGANILTEGHEFMIIEDKSYPTIVTSECQLGCGHSAFLM